MRDLIRGAMLGWRSRFQAMFESTACRYPPQDAVSAADLADMFVSLDDGAIILPRALREPKALARQILMFHSDVKVLYAPQRAYA